jgi:hypothetical protein
LSFVIGAFGSLVGGQAPLRNDAVAVSLPALAGQRRASVLAGAQVAPASQFPSSPGVRGHAGICALSQERTFRFLLAPSEGCVRPVFCFRRGIRALGSPRHGIRKALSGLCGRLLKLGQNREIRFRTRDILTDVANLVGGRTSRISDRSSRQDSTQVRMPSRSSEEWPVATTPASV